MGTRINFVYGVGGPLIPVMPTPVIAQRAPAVTDTSYPPGQDWIDQSTSPATLYTFSGGTSSGNWLSGGNEQATTTTAGITRYATYAEVSTGTGTENAALAADVYTYVNSVAIAGAPAATESVAGIAEIATQAETNTGTDDARIVTPLKLATLLTTPPAIGGTTPAAGAFTTLGFST